MRFCQGQKRATFNQKTEVLSATVRRVSILTMTVFVILPLYTTTIELEKSNQDMIDVKTFRTINNLGNIHIFFKNAPHFQRLKLKWTNKKLHI